MEQITINSYTSPEIIPAETEAEELVTILSLPEIETSIDVIIPQIRERSARACSLVCTLENKKAIKDVRAGLNKEKTSLSDSFKRAMAAVKAPILEVESKFKVIIAEYAKADSELAAKITAVEDEVKAQKREELEEFFNETAAAAEVDFIKFDTVIPKINLSESVKRYKDKIKGFFDRVQRDTDMIAQQENADEIMIEYQKSLDLSSAMLTVQSRKKRIEQAQKRREEQREQAENAAAMRARVESIAEKAEPQTAEVQIQEPIQTPVQEVVQEPIQAPAVEKRTFKLPFWAVVQTETAEEAKEIFRDMKKILESRGVKLEKLDINN